MKAIEKASGSVVEQTPEVSQPPIEPLPMKVLPVSQPSVYVDGEEVFFTQVPLIGADTRSGVSRSFLSSCRETNRAESSRKLPRE